VYYCNQTPPNARENLSWLVKTYIQPFETGAHNQRVQSGRRPAARCEYGFKGGQFGSAKRLHGDNLTVMS
jgi:hypothetical protein